MTGAWKEVRQSISRGRQLSHARHPLAGCGGGDLRPERVADLLGK